MTQTIHIDDLKIGPDRQRQEFKAEALTELMESLEVCGQLHPIVINGDFTLVAGERRTQAIKMLAFRGVRIKHGAEQMPLGHIAFTFLSDQTPEGRYTAELHENVVREDLSWQERALALERLATLRPKVAGETPAEAFAALAHDALPTLVEPTKTAAQLLAVASHLENPEVMKAKSLPDAVKIVRRYEARKRDEALGLAAGKESATNRHTLVNADCLTALALRAAGLSELFDVLLTDPPYGMGADAFGDGGGKLTGITHEYEDGFQGTLNLIVKMIEAVTPLMKAQAHLYMYCDIDMFPLLREVVRDAGWMPHRTPLIHLKREGGRVPWPENGPRRAYELVLYAIRGKMPVKSIYPDVFDTTLFEGNLGHGAQKPVEGFVNLLKRSVSPGMTVLDPFGGTGTTMVAAHELGCKSVVIEQDVGAYGIALQRLKELK